MYFQRTVPASSASSFIAVAVSVSILALLGLVAVAALPWPRPDPRPMQILLPLTAAGPVRLPTSVGTGTGASLPNFGTFTVHRPQSKPLGPVYLRPSMTGQSQSRLDLDNSAPSSAEDDDDDDSNGDKEPDYAYNHDDSAEERRKAQRYVEDIVAELGLTDLERDLQKQKLAQKQREKDKKQKQTQKQKQKQKGKPQKAKNVKKQVSGQKTSSTRVSLSTSTSTSTTTTTPKPSTTTTSKPVASAAKSEFNDEEVSSFEQLVIDDVALLDPSSPQGHKQGYRNPYLKYTSSDNDIDPQLDSASYADLVRIKHELLVSDHHASWSWWDLLWWPMKWFKSASLFLFCKWHHHKHWACNIDEWEDFRRRSLVG